MTVPPGQDQLTILRIALTKARDMLAAIAGDLDDGADLRELRGKYLFAVINSRDDAADALRAAFGAAS